MFLTEELNRSSKTLLQARKQLALPKPAAGTLNCSPFLANLKKASTPFLRMISLTQVFNRVKTIASNMIQNAALHSTWVRRLEETRELYQVALTSTVIKTTWAKCQNRISIYSSVVSIS